MDTDEAEASTDVDDPRIARETQSGGERVSRVIYLRQWAERTEGSRAANSQSVGRSTLILI